MIQMLKKCITTLIITTLLNISNQTALHGMNDSENPKTFFDELRTLPTELQEKILLLQDAITFLGQQPITLSEHTKSIEAISVSDDKFATRCYGRVVKIWDMHGICLRTFPKSGKFEYDKHIYSIALHGNKLATGHSAKTVNIWNIDTGLCLYTLKELKKDKSHDSRVTSILMNDNTLIAASGETVHIWDMLTKECTCTFSPTTGSTINSIVTNGDVIGTGCSDGIVKVWDYTGTCIHAFEEFKGKICGVTSVSMNKDKIAAISYCGSLKIWDITTDTCIFTYEKLKGQPNERRSLAISEDKIITGSADGTAQIRNLATHELLHVFAGPNKHTDGANRIALTAKNVAITGSADKTIKIWPLLINLQGTPDDNSLQWIIQKSDLPQLNFIARAYDATITEEKFIMVFPSEDIKIFLTLPAHVKQYLLARLKIRR